MYAITYVTHMYTYSLSTALSGIDVAPVQVTNWREINFEQAWDDLKRKYGEKLEWWHMAAAIGSIFQTTLDVNPVEQVKSKNIHKV
jgi:hypothetical protein